MNAPEGSGADRSAGASVRSAMAGVARFRADLGKGAFYKLLLAAYTVLAIQVIGLAKFDLLVAAGMVEAAPVSNLLFTVPALTLLPAVQFMAITVIVLYLASKGEVPREVRKEASFFVWASLILLLVPVVLLTLTLPIALVLVLALFCIVFFGHQPLKALLTRSTNIGGADGYTKAVAGSARAITDLWGSHGDDVSPESFLTVTEDAAARTRLGVWLVASGLVLGMVAFWPRPWMPTRVIVTSEKFSEHQCGVETLPKKSKDLKAEEQSQIVGFPIGESAGRLTVLTSSRRCLLTLNIELVESEYVCRSSETPIYVRTVLGTLSGNAVQNPTCPD